MPDAILVTTLSQEDMQDKDIRAGVVSASSMERLYLCRGSANLERGLTDLRVVDEVRDTGSDIHAVLAGELSPEVLDEDALWMYERCQEYEKEVVGSAFGFVEERELKVFKEDRFYLRLNGVIENSGEFDKLYIHPEAAKALIIDYKTGYNGVSKPEENIQLRNYAVLTYLFYKKEYGLKEIEVCAIQPRVKPVYARCTYSELDLMNALNEMLHVIKDGKRANAERNPGIKQCMYCRAIALCDEARKEAKRGALRIEGIKEKLGILPAEITSAILTEREKLASGKEIAQALNDLKFHKKVSDAITLEAKTRLKHSHSVPGWTIGKGKVLKEFTDLEKVRKILKEFMSPKQIDDCSDISVSQVEKLVGEGVGKKGKALKEHMNDLFGLLILEKTSEGSLEKVETEE